MTGAGSAADPEVVIGAVVDAREVAQGLAVVIDTVAVIETIVVPVMSAHDETAIGAGAGVEAGPVTGVLHLQSTQRLVRVIAQCCTRVSDD